MSNDDLAAWLRRKAIELSRGLPVDVEAIIAAEGVLLRRVEPEHSLLRDGEARRTREGKFVIAYVHRRRERSRFTLAHELAHILLSRDLNCEPADESNYWWHERLCDDFAGRLLIRDEVLDSLRRRSLVDWTRAVATTTVTSTETAARRVTNVRPNASIAELAHGNNKAGQRVAIVRWIAGRRISGFGPRKHLTRETKVGQLAEEMLRGEAWADLARNLWPDAVLETHRSRVRSAVLLGVTWIDEKAAVSSG